MIRFARLLFFGPMIAAAALAEPPPGPAIGDSLVVRGQIELRKDGDDLALHYELPEGDEYDVTLVVDLGGRSPSVHRPRSVGGDVGESVPGGTGQVAIWYARDDRRRLTGRETAWVVAIPGAARLPLYRDGPLAGMRFAYVPEGSFWMGSADTEQSRRENEGPIVPQSFVSFEMLATEVTQTHFEEVMGRNPSRMRHAHRPVEQVSWFDAVLFCDKLAERDREHVYRLPTEAEWEYACRAGTSTPYYWDFEPGVSFPEGDAAMMRHGWYTGNAGGKTRPVAELEPNAWGLYDMHGNAWEWCLDGYADRHPPPGPAPAVRLVAWPPDLAPGSRVVRGGSWRSPAHQCRSASRKARDPDDTGKDTGFRVVRTRSN